MRHLLFLIRLTMIACFLLLGLRLGELVHEGEKWWMVKDAEAEAPPEEAKKTETAPEAGKPLSEKTPSSDNAEGPKVTPPSTEPAENAEEGQGKPQFSQTEIDLLQSLARRRQEIDRWGKEVQLRENMLTATEQRINDKITTLQNMRRELERLLAQYNEQEDAKIRSLVKIYENMKPKDAGRIFDELEMPVLLAVVDKMSERKVALILADMNPAKAREVTVQLAEQRKLEKPKMAGAQNALGDGTAPDAAAAPASQGR
jgi:flagellar motility protein MotE (MotC chaperone)